MLQTKNKSIETIYFPNFLSMGPLPLKASSWYLPDWLHFDAFNLLAFAFVIFGIKPAQCCLPIFQYYLQVMFWIS